MRANLEEVSPPEYATMNKKAITAVRSAAVNFRLLNVRATARLAMQDSVNANA